MDVSLSDVGTNSSDYANYVSAIESAVAAYAGPGAVTFDTASQIITFTAANDGDVMAPLNVDLALTDDAFAEGAEDFTLTLATASSSTGVSVGIDATAVSVTTTINDTQGVGGIADGPAQWSITGPALADEGSTAQYTVSLGGTYGENETITVDLGLTDVDTNSSDYGNLIAAINAAVVGKPGVSFNSTTGTLSYVAPSDGASMADLLIDLPLTDDVFIEGPENFSLNLTNATTSTGLTASIDAAAASAITTINDTQGPAGAVDGPGEWSIIGPADGDEGTTAQYTIALTGMYGSGEVLSIDLGLTDIDTNSSDYANVAAAINTAVAANPDVTFDASTGMLVFTAPSDGATMADIVIDLALADDVIIEGPEDFSLNLSNPGSSSGAAVAVDASASTVTTTINDTQGPNGVGDGPAEWSLTGVMSVDEADLASYTVELAGSYGAGDEVSVA